MMRKFLLFISVFNLFIFSGCQSTVDLEKVTKIEDNKIDKNTENNEEEKNIVIVENEIIPEKEIVYIERPVYRPAESSSSTDVNLTIGKEAAVKSLKEATKKPQLYNKGMFYYQFDEKFVYEIYCQPYHHTDIYLEPGEVILGKPFFSEDDSVWELTANISKDSVTGLDIQHLYLKPAYSKLDSSLIVTTNRRVYHFRPISYSDTHMAMVSFTYPNKPNVWISENEKNDTTKENPFIKVSNPELISFNYVMKFNKFRKPDFIPIAVFDDGQSTFIQVKDIVLQKKLPVLFDEKNNIVNYIVNKNTFIVNKLINKVTLVLDKQKVVIEKKISK